MLNVPLLAAGEVHLLRRGQVLDIAVWVVLAFVFAYTVAVTRGADVTRPPSRSNSRRAKTSSVMGPPHTSSRS